ncbi:MAG: YqzL family protein [Peptococcaceae bacterium]
MQVKDFFWRYFKETGGIGAYLIYKELIKEEEFVSLKAVPDEE